MIYVCKKNNLETSILLLFPISSIVLATDVVVLFTACFSCIQCTGEIVINAHEEYNIAIYSQVVNNPKFA